MNIIIIDLLLLLLSSFPKKGAEPSIAAESTSTVLDGSSRQKCVQTESGRRRCPRSLY